MGRLPWKQAARMWRCAFLDCQALLAMHRAVLDDSGRLLAEAHDELTVARAAHNELIVAFDQIRAERNNMRLAYDAIRAKLWAAQSELAQRATHDIIPRSTYQHWLDAFERSGLSRDDALHIWAELAAPDVVPAVPRYIEDERGAA